MTEGAANDRPSLSHALPPPILNFDQLHPSRSVSHDVFLEEGQNAIELTNLTQEYSKASEEDTRDRRRAQKRERKLQQIREREEMKFSHSIQFNAVPDWSSHYISYSNLKKL